MEGGGRSCPALGGHFLRCCEQRLCGPPRPGAALLPAPGHRSLLTPTSPYLRARGHAMPPDQTLLRTFPGLRSAANPAGARATQAASAGPRPAAAPLPEPASPHARGLHPAQNSTQNLGAGRDGDYWRGKKERERTWSPHKQAVHSAAAAPPPQPNGFKSLRADGSLASSITGGGTTELACPAPSSPGWHSTRLPWRRAGLRLSLPLTSEGAGIPPSGVPLSCQGRRLPH